jgi:predicted NBD/HSP70 family sugar kinase
MSLRLGVDLGGTKIEIVALEGEDTVLARRRVPTPQGDYAGTVRAIIGLVLETESALGRRGTLGIGIPGALSPATGLVRNANSVCLIGQPLRDDLQAALQREVRIENDANCFAVAEAQAGGAAEGVATVFGVILGTGVGGGLVVEGRVLRGANAIAGEWGHNPLPLFAPADAPPGRPSREWPGEPCYCGHRGCLETWLSGPALARLGGRSDRDAAAVVAAARAGEPMAVAAMADYIDRLARALASVINLVDPQAIVLGGGLSQIARLYDEVPARWPRYVFADSVGTRLLHNRLGDSAGVFGAARLWPAGASIG